MGAVNGREAAKGPQPATPIGPLIQKARRQIDRLVLAVKASGGYHYRERIHLSDVELEKLVDTAEAQIRTGLLRLIVAEEMLQETPPRHPWWWRVIHREVTTSRWAEYGDRLRMAEDRQGGEKP